MERFVTVPKEVLLKDYLISKSSPKKKGGLPGRPRQFRYLASEAISPWGSITTWMLPATKIALDADGTALVVTLSVPPSRMRHFMSDASLFILEGGHGGVLHKEIIKAVLRINGEEVQCIDSEFAYNVAMVYKRGFTPRDNVSFDTLENSKTYSCPFFFGDPSPLRALPLFLHPIEIEYHLRVGGSTASSTSSTPPQYQFISKFTSSPGEDPGQRLRIGQYVPCFSTFRSGRINNPLAHEVSISVKLPDDNKLARCLYVRATNTDWSDIKDAIASINIVPAGVKTPPMALPGSVCRTHLKTDFGLTGCSTQQIFASPYYVLPFTSAPRGHNPDYGIPLPEGSVVNIALHPGESRVAREVVLEVCVEFFNAFVWHRIPIENEDKQQ